MGRRSTRADRRRERPVGLDLHEHVAALEAQVRVPRERAGEEPALGQDLEAVADAEDVAAARGVLRDGAHDRADLRDGAAAQVVAVAEAAGDRDEVGAGRAATCRVCQTVVTSAPASWSVRIISASAFSPGKTTTAARMPSE